MSQDTHKLMLSHSQAKVKLYGDYVAKYLNIIIQDKITTDIHFYDLFCGEGLYENGTKGSPMIALDKIKSSYANFEKMPNIKVTFNDIDSGVITKLKNCLATANVPSQCGVEVLNDNYLNLREKVKAEIKKFKKEKAIIFLDPKGYKEISISDIKGFLDNNKTEVLVFLPIRDMNRFANMNINNISPGHEPLYKFISEVFPQGAPHFTSQIDFINKVKGGLKNILPEFYIDTFILEREPGQFFALFFFTSHIYGFEKMLETKWDIDSEQGRILRYEKTGAMFSGSEVLDFPNTLKNYLSSKKRYNGEVYSFTLHEGFLPKHANDILRDWQQKNDLNVFSADNQQPRKNAFYNTYQDYKENPEKIYYTVNYALF